MKRSVGLLLFVVLGLVPACRSAMLVNPDPIPAGPSQAATRAAILEATQARSWAATEESPGVVHAAVLVRGKHELQVAISYDDKRVRMVYEGSRNLDYSQHNGREYIHSNAVGWMNLLWWDIQKALANARTVKGSGT